VIPAAEPQNVPQLGACNEAGARAPDGAQCSTYDIGTLQRGRRNVSEIGLEALENGFEQPRHACTSCELVDLLGGLYKMTQP
jgi:hypothetical protein